MKSETKRLLGAMLLGPLSLLLFWPIALAMFPFGIVLGFRQVPYYNEIYLALTASLSSTIAGFLAYAVFRSRRLAVVCFFSGFVSLAAQYGVERLLSEQKQRGYEKEMKAISDVYRREILGYASIGPLRYEVGRRVDQTYNHFPQFGPLYDSLFFVVPLEVHRPGRFGLEVRCKGRPIEMRHTLVDSFPAGKHDLRFGGSALSVYSLEAIGGRVIVELDAEIDVDEYTSFYATRLKNRTFRGGGLTNSFHGRAGEVRMWASIQIDSAMTVFPILRQYPADTLWQPRRPPSPPRLTDLQEMNLRRRAKR